MAAKQRILSIDYFRGVSMLALVINHAYVFTLPLAYLTGIGRLWTSTAELFFIISGLTFGVIRSDMAQTSFRRLLSKSWGRAYTLYIWNIIAVLGSLILASVIFHFHQTPDINGNLPTTGFGSMLLGVLTLKYVYGSAAFLAYYAVFLFLAPFLLKALYKRYWWLVPAASIGLFVLTTSPDLRTDQGLISYGYLCIWQIYFVIGLMMARFSKPLMSLLARIEQRRSLSRLIIGSTTVILGLSAYLAFSKPQNMVMAFISRHNAVWLKAVPDFLSAHHATLDHWLLHERTGLLRPFVSLFVVTSLGIIYYRHADWLQRKTGNFVNAVGSNSLYIYLAQALAIPILAALPLSHSNLLTKAVLTAVLLEIVWLVARKPISWQTLYNLASKAGDALQNTAYLYRRLVRYNWFW